MSKKHKREAKKLRKKLKKAVKKAEVAAEETQAQLRAAPLPTPPSPWANYDLAARTAMAKQPGLVVNPFDTARFHRPMPGVVPKPVLEASKHGLAMDETVIEVNAWSAGQVYNSAFFNGQAFLGYTYLAELAQRPEYRKPAEALATESTRKWIKLKSKAGDEEKADRIKDLEAHMDKHGVQPLFRKMSEYDSFFGRMHLYVDTGDTDNADELRKSIGDGRDAITEGKFKGKPGFLRALRAIEPVWCYPASYNSTDPLKAEWYDPQTWFVLGKEVHRTRLLLFVAREVPDLLKPSYQFGGLSLSQMAKPYIDNWLRTRQAVADLIWTFSTMILSTDTETLVQPGAELLMNRLQVFSNLRTNQGLMVLNKSSEELNNVSVPLSTLDALQAQSQEQMCSVTNTPVVKLLGIQPAGLNASSQGELTVWYDWNAAYQEKFYDPRLTTVIDLLQYDLWGERDPDIVHEWEPIEELTEEQKANVQKTKADTDGALIGAGVIDADESRERLASDPSSDYAGKLSGEAPGPPGGEMGEMGLGDPGEEGQDDVDGAMAEVFPRLATRSRLEHERRAGAAEVGRRVDDLERRTSGLERRDDGRGPRVAGARN